MPHQHKLLWIKRHEVDNAFEEPADILERCRLNDCSQLVFISHTKKRPHCVQFTRLFDFQVLDSYEFVLAPLQDCSQLQKINLSVEFKPLLVFEGVEFTNDPVFAGLKNFFMDFFRGDPQRK